MEFIELNANLSFCIKHQQFEWDIVGLYFPENEDEAVEHVLASDSAETIGEAWAAIGHAMVDFYDVTWFNGD